MPDATITSTASTFGTISGTFAADQSTVTGTITGTVTGTLTGSVGVPGPQGPTGATGATGATGPAGSPGAPGQGVPVGGTAGQFLSKIDSTNYNTDWTTVNLSVYAVKANNLSDLADAGTARTNLGLGTMATATAADYSTTTAANGLYYPLSGNPSGFLTSVPPPTLTNLTSDISWDGSANTGRLLIAGVNDIGGGFTEARLNFTSGVPNQPATGDFWTNGTDFFYRESGSTKTIASQSYVSATYQTLAGMSSYLTTATAASTYAVIAAGQPTAGTTGQVLTKNSGTNYDSSWATVIPGDRYLTSSTTSNTVSNGNKTFTIGTGLSYTPTQNITISYDAANHMHGEVLTYNSGTGVLTVDIKNHTGSGTYTAWVVNVGGVTPATSVDFADITGAVSGNANLQAALDLKANLASPTFTGTPTLPTGTIATTQSPGNNTTAVATTAFVTAAVPAFATISDTNSPSSTTTVMSPSNVLDLILSANFQMLYYGAGVSGASGTGAGFGNNGGRWHDLASPNASISGYGAWCFDTNSNSVGFAASDRGASPISKNWSKKIWLAGRTSIGNYPNTTLDGDVNTFHRVSLGGKNSFSAGDISSAIRGIGFKIPGGGASAMILQVSNGSTVTSVTSSFTPTLRQVFDWKIYSDGTGNVTLYVNDSQVATTTAGPTGQANYGLYFEMSDSNGSNTKGFLASNFGTKIYYSI